MLSFNDLQEKKTKIKLNPKKDDVMEGSCGSMPKMAKGGAITVDKLKNNHGDDCGCVKCDKKRRKEDLGDEKTVSTEETAYVSQEEVSEESTKESDSEANLLTFNQYFDEATRLKKEKGYDKGGTRKPSGKPSAMDFVRAEITKKYGKGALMGSGSRQKKKEKGAKSDAGTGKYKRAADAKKQTAADAKKRGFKSTQNYVDTMARYGGKDNYDKGRGLGS
ncbi:hypothetical protein SSSM5_180 [Synechococcus phage S-SSM5]|uniref:Uncharacterized protein n=1 Tax=Synechococcus phage S-SSM5 TaxID=445685 RepID=E3SKM0_9CAUD|nr:hypothetical protein SSSM5_180 [Synechococcus phage S-SSM5]ADO97890.1 hypothetical protein SSSM5_180 [Synechococcus phage S-SSM5]